MQDDRVDGSHRDGNWQGRESSNTMAEYDSNRSSISGGPTAFLLIGWSVGLSVIGLSLKTLPSAISEHFLDKIHCNAIFVFVLDPYYQIIIPKS